VSQPEAPENRAGEGATGGRRAPRPCAKTASTRPELAPAEILVVGGGLAGSAAAIVLARAGRAVTLVEREAAPRPKVCGEFLSVSALACLDALGVPAAALGAVPLSHLRVAAGGAPTTMPLAFRAAALTRERLDGALIDAAAFAGATIARGRAVRALAREDGHWRADLGGERIAARTVLLATGKTDLRGRRRPDGLHAHMVGLKRYAVPARPVAPFVDVVLFPGGYCGIAPVQDGRLNVCLALSADTLKGAGGADGAFETVLRASPHARALLGDAEIDTRTLAVGRVPYGFVRHRTDGPFHLGDQAAVIGSFCGEGMGLALASGIRAAEAILAGRDAEAFQRDFARLSGLRVPATGLLSRALCAAALQPAAMSLARRAPGFVGRVSRALRTPVAQDPAGDKPGACRRPEPAGRSARPALMDPRMSGRNGGQ